MLSREDLEAIGQLIDAKLVGQKAEIGQLMDVKLAAQKAEIGQLIDAESVGQKAEIGQLMDVKLAAQKKEIIQEVGVMIENEVTPKFNLLAEGQEDILRKMPSEDDMDIIDGRLTDLEKTVRRHETEIAALKRAN